MIKFVNIDQGIINASRLMLTNDGLNEAAVDVYMNTHQTDILIAGRAAIEGETDLRALTPLRTAIRTYLDDNPT